MLYTGIDLHKRTVSLATVDAQGTLVTEARLPTSRGAVAGYFSELPEPSLATVEATSCWYWVRELLDTEQVPLTLAHATFLYMFSFVRSAKRAERLRRNSEDQPRNARTPRR
jgi:hypothetical protein